VTVVADKLATCNFGFFLLIRESGGVYKSSGFLFEDKTFSMYRWLDPTGKFARTRTVTEVSGGITILAADHTFLSEF
jgi:hypothetical protein